ncbi:hypothetical protein BKA80DRAFT_313622 [Phyllosticta citrichinensis]
MGFLVLCPETSSNYPYADRAETLSTFRKENTSSEHLAAITADLKLRPNSEYIPAAETPVTAKSEIVMDASAKARSPSVSSNRSSSSSSTATAAQTPRFLKVCPVHYGRGDGPDDFSPA